jgi:hypothetical protein
MKLYAPRKDGSRIVDHILAALEQAGDDAKWPDDFPLPEIPPQLNQVWDWYWQIRAGAPSGVNGSEPVSHVEMLAWATMAQTAICPATLRYFRILDLEYLNAMAKQAKTAKSGKPAGKR